MQEALESVRLSFWRWAVPETLLRKRSVLGIAGLSVCLLAALEWYFKLDVSLGIAYTIPVAAAALVLTRPQILLAAMFCAYIRGQFTPQYPLLEQTLRWLMATIAYLGVGLLVAEMSRNRKTAVAVMTRIKLEQILRKRAEEQLRLLAESSPAGVLTVDGQGYVLAANRAMAQLLGASVEQLVGRSIEGSLSFLARALHLPPGARPMRTATSAWAKRADGAMVPIMSWFSTYVSDDQRYLAAIVVDVSEEVRDRDRENYRHLADAQRLMASAVSHEIRNMCSAIAVVSANIERRSQVAQDPDWTALTNLTAGLSRIASFDLKTRAPEPHGPASSITLRAVLDELRVVIEQDWQDEDATLHIETAESLPPVEADHHGLMQVFLNLAQNSLRAVSSNPGSDDPARVRDKALTITAVRKAAHVVVSFVDSGHGVANAENLFQPFRPGADGTGLGLYVSRALMRSFRGELVFVPSAQGCQFDVMLPTRESRTTDAPISD